MDPDVNIIPGIILVIILTLINAFFSLSEMAIVSVNKNKIRILAEEGNSKAIAVEKLLGEPTNFLSTIQVAITFAGFFSSASAASGLSVQFQVFLAQFSIPFSQQIALVVITLAISYLSLVFGELVPKRIALQKAEAISMFCVRPIQIVGKILFPFIKFISLSTNLVLRMIGMHHENIEEQVSEEEIRSMVAVGKESGVFNKTEQEMIEGIFEFDDIVAEEVMTPRTSVYSVDITEPLSENLDELMEMKHSRVPIYEDDIDHVIGILNMKDFTIQARKVGFDNVDIRSILRKPFFVAETKNIDVLFKEMQQNHEQIAIIVDEYGGFSGIVTMEDIIEEIMGNINDEYDDYKQDFITINPSTFIVSGQYSLDDLNDKLHAHIPNEEYETVNGFLIDLLGHIPEDGEKQKIDYENLMFEILVVKDKRIQKVKIHVLDKPKKEDENIEATE